ncbi:MAG TPA: LuxR C-terminal-related transcriptional regulator [Dongiaceae bacterium]|nr:LuxR C-terminal-related transcriptional regulator [Dongiaceae bacterium]
MTHKAGLAAGDLAAWNKAAVAALTATTPDAIAAALEGALRQVLEFDVILVAALYRDAPPGAPYYGGGIEEPSPAYHDGPYLLDPFYNRFLAGTTEGCFRLSDLVPEGFLRSEYFSSYYRHLEIGDELGLLTALDSRSAAHVSLTRQRGRGRFTSRDAEWLLAAAPLAREAIRRMNAGAAPTRADPAAFHEGLRRAYERFGTSVLTERERDVVHLLLQGNSAKAIARALNISPDTARNHLKRIYPKLEVSSQAELFALFFQALAQVEPGFDGDPLSRLVR